MVIDNQEELDDSQIAMRIAMRAGLFVSLSFFVFSIVQLNIPKFEYFGFIDLLFRLFFVFFGLIISSQIIRLGVRVPNSAGIPFLSTVFFYGMTVLLTTVLQLGIIVFSIIFFDAFTFKEQLQMIFGIRDFSIKSLLLVFLAGHLPYVLYFLYLKYLLKQFQKH